jgi:hypothetical protein
MVRESNDVWEDCSCNVDGRIHSWVQLPLDYDLLPANYCSRLGDRHCENILLDSNTGDVVHVDFNCLFEKVWGYYGIFGNV